MAATKQAVLDTGVGDHHASHSTAMAAVPHIILLGYGVTDTLQLTVESQRFLARFGSAYAIGLPPNLKAFLKSQRVRVTDLGHKLAPGREVAGADLDSDSRGRFVAGLFFRWSAGDGLAEAVTDTPPRAQAVAAW